MVAQNKKAGAAGDGGNAFEECTHPYVSRRGPIR